MKKVNSWRESDATPLSQQLVAPGPSLSLMARRVNSSSNSLGSSLPIEFSAISLSPVGKSGFADSRTLCAPSVKYETPTPDPRCQRSTLLCIGDFPIGKSTDERWRFTHLSRLRTPMCDATCCPPLRLRGTRRNSGLRCSSVLPSTSKTPKC
jgi:hypothetical protein